jgi:hypothetical protein
MSVYQEQARINAFRPEDERWTEEQLVARTQEIVGAFSTGTELEPELEKITYLGKEFQVQPQSDGTFRLINSDGITAPQVITRENLETMRGN